jgi:hypothetical protein
MSSFLRNQLIDFLLCFLAGRNGANQVTYMISESVTPKHTKKNKISHINISAATRWKSKTF